MNYLGIDVGSTNIKCRLSTENNDILFAYEHAYAMLEIDQHTYVDIEQINIELEQMIVKASTHGKIDAISISSFGESFALLDESDQVLMHPMLYTDERGEDEAKEITNIISKADIFSITGTTPQSLYSIYKLLWFKKHYPEKYKKANKFVQIGDFLNYKLTGKHITDYSLASRSGVFDLEQKEFSKALLDKLNINRSLFPKPYKTGTIIGHVSDEFAKKCNLDTSCQVIIGGHDQVMAAIGAGVIDNHMAVDGMGTVECLTPVFSDKVNALEMGLKGYVNVPFFDSYCTYMFNYTGGSLVKWVKHNIFQNSITEHEMAELVMKECQDGPTGLLTLPYFSGAATPRQNIHAKGSIINLSSHTKSSDIYKSILEGLAFEMKYNLDMANDFGISVNKIIASGGGSKSSLWLRIKADVFNQEIYPLADKESGITGAIILCAVALNASVDIKEAVQKFVTYKEPIKPRKAYVDLYKKQYQKYLRVYDAVLEFSKE